MPALAVPLYVAITGLTVLGHALGIRRQFCGQRQRLLARNVFGAVHSAAQDRLRGSADPG